MDELFLDPNDINLIASSLIRQLPELFLYLCIIFFTHKLKNKSYTRTYLLTGGYISVASISFNLFNFGYSYYNYFGLGTLASFVFYSGKYIVLFGIILLLFDKVQPKIKQSIPICILLSFVSMGIFAPFWHIKLHKLSKVKPIGTTILTVFVVSSILTTISLLYASRNNSEEMIMFYFFRIVTYVTHLILLFKMRKSLLQNYPEVKEISKALTFFFGIFYLQYIINKHEQYLLEELAKGDG